MIIGVCREVVLYYMDTYCIMYFTHHSAAASTPLLPVADTAVSLYKYMLLIIIINLNTIMGDPHIIEDFKNLSDKTTEFVRFFGFNSTYTL